MNTQYSTADGASYPCRHLADSRRLTRAQRVVVVGTALLAAADISATAASSGAGNSTPTSPSGAAPPHPKHTHPSLAGRISTIDARSGR